MIKKNDLTPILLFCFICSFIYTLPLLLANQFYSDDIKRQTTGEGWFDDGRPVATFIMQFLSGGSAIKDLFPYTLVIGAFLIALSGYIISFVSGIEKRNTLKISSLVLLSSPLMIENLSYRYDVLTIAFSIFLTVFPFLFKENKIKFITIASICLSISLFTYQASLILYVLVVLLLLLEYCFVGRRFKEILYKISFFTIPALIAVIVMKGISIGTQIEYHGRDKTILSSDYPFLQLKMNWENIYSLMRFVFISPLYSIFFILLLGLFLFALFLYLRKAKIITHKLLSFFFLLCIPLIIIIIPLLIENTFIVPRLFVGFSFFVYGALLFIDKFFPKTTALVSGLYLLCAVPVMASLGKFLKEQHDLQQFIITDIVAHTDIHQKAFIFDGQVPISKDSERTLEKYFFLRYFYISFLGNENYLFDSYFQSKSHYLYSPIFLKGEERKLLLQIKYTIPIVHTTNYYHIRANENSVIIDFTKASIEHPVLTTEAPDNQSVEINYNLEKLNIENNILYIKGWSFERQNNTPILKKKILFKNENNIYTSNTRTEIRKDVSDYFKSNHDDSGFAAEISLDSLPKGWYTIGILLDKKNTKTYQLTDKMIEIK